MSVLDYRSTTWDELVAKAPFVAYITNVPFDMRGKLRDAACNFHETDFDSLTTCIGFCLFRSGKDFHPRKI